MKVFIFSLISISILLTSCNTSLTESKSCDLEGDVKIEPLCVFNPKVDQSKEFPVWVLFNGTQISTD